MNIAIYTRKSVFSDKSDSVESQAKICREYSKNNFEVTTITEYEDEGFTGANTNRPGFSNLMKDILNKKLDILVCYKIDRISRNVLDFSETFNTLQQYNVAFVSVKEQIDTSTPLGRAMMYICSVFAQMERETTAERVRDSMVELAKSGKWTGGQAPLGYKLEKIVTNGKNHTMLVRNEEALPFLNFIYEKFLEGYTLNGLETYFRNNNISGFNGKYFYSTQIYQILKNPHYVEATKEIYDYFSDKGCIMASEKKLFDGKNGLIVYGRTSGGKKKKHTVNTPDKWIVCIGVHAPIINSDTWLEVQDRFGKNVIDKTRKHKIGILKGIVKCKCGHPMRVQHKVDNKYNKIYDNYFCQNRNRGGLCDLSMISVDALDTKLISTLKEISVNKDLLRTFIKDSKTTVCMRSSNDIKKEIVATERKINNLTVTLRENIASSASRYIILDIEVLDKQVASLNYELRDVEIREREKGKREENIDIIYDKICNYLNRFDLITYEDKVLFLKEIIKSCIWDGNSLFLTF